MSGGPRPEIRLGNDIVRAFRHLPHDEALAAIAGHVRRFWEPRMRRALVDRVEGGDADADPLLTEAVRTHLAELSEDRTPA